MNSSSPALGEEQFIDVELDRNTEFLPSEQISTEVNDWNDTNFSESEIQATESCGRDGYAGHDGDEQDEPGAFISVSRFDNSGAYGSVFDGSGRICSQAQVNCFSISYDDERYASQGSIFSSVWCILLRLW